MLTEDEKIAVANSVYESLARFVLDRFPDLTQKDIWIMGYVTALEDIETV